MIKIITGDCLDVLKDLPDESVHCVVTSPPYWGLRDYGVDGQMGLERCLGDHVDGMVAVFREVRRVLRSDGTLWLNYGDSYAASPNGRKAADIVGDDRAFRDKPFSTVGAIYDPEHRPNGTNKTRGRNSGSKQLTDDDALPPSGRIVAGGILKPKDLCGIPWRVAFALQADGWWLRQDIIWSKPNPMPESVTDRCTKAHEYLFLMSKAERYYYDAEAIKEPAIYTGLANQDDSGFKNPQSFNGKHKNGYRSSDNKTHKAVTEYERSNSEEHRTKAGLLKIADTAYASRNKRSVWEIATAPFSEAHFATFPPALIEPCILAGCPKGGTVLDPFGGAGTTGLVADRLGRNAILIELNPEYAAMAERRIRDDAGMFAQVEAAE